MSTGELGDRPRRHKRLIGGILLLIVLTVAVWLFSRPLAAYLLPILAVAFGVEILLLTAATDIERLPGGWQPGGAAAILLAALVLAIVGVMVLAARGGRPQSYLLGAVFGVAAGLIVIWLDGQVPDRPRFATLVFALVVVVAFASGVIALAHAAGIWPAGRRATIIAGGHLGVVLTVGTYVAATLFARGPAGVFPGLVERARRRA